MYSKNFQNLIVINYPLIRELLLFINGCTLNAKTIIVLKNEIVHGRLIYERYRNHEDELTSKCARELLEFSSA